jgi:hypothetical protein
MVRERYRAARKSRIDAEFVDGVLHQWAQQMCGGIAKLDDAETQSDRSR